MTSLMMLQKNNSIVVNDMAYIIDACQADFMQLAGHKILITGGSGFIGSYLVESLIAWNKERPDLKIMAVLPTRKLERVRRQWPDFFNHAELQWIEWAALSSVGAMTPCDYVIHAASPSDPASYMDDPLQAMRSIVDVTMDVLDMSRQWNVKSVLYLSSGAVYGPQPDDVLTLHESFLGAPDINDPRSCYGEAKRYAELACVSSGLPVVRARLFSFLGPYQDMTTSFAMPDFLRQATENHIIKMNSHGLAQRTYCYASDLTIALWKLLCCEEHGDVFNVGGADAISILELAQLVARIVGDVEVKHQPIVDGQVQRITRYVPDIKKLKQIYTPRISLSDSVQRVLSAHGIYKA